MQTLSSVRNENASPVVYIVRQSTLAKIDVSRETILWQRQIIGSGSTMLLYSDVLYLYSSLHESIVYAFHCEDGRLLWRIQIAAYTMRAGVQLNEIVHLQLVAGILYVVLRDGSLYALDAGQGTLLWRNKTSPLLDEAFPGSFSLVVEGDMLYCIEGNRLYALVARSGQQRWEHVIDGRLCLLAHTLAHNVVYACADLDPKGTYIYAVDARIGKRLWRSALFEDPVFEAPCVIEDHLYCVGAHNVYLLSRQTGQLLWMRPVGTTNFCAPIVVGNLLFLGVYDDDVQEQPQGAILALKCRDGIPDWYRRFPHKPYIQGHWQQQICVSDEHLNRLYVFDAHQGTLLWRLNTSAIGDGRIAGSCSALVLAGA